jgi:hypothetical protein
MNDNSGLDLTSLAVRLVLAFVLIGATIGLIPILLQALWNIMPSILILMLIVGVLRAMVKRLLG